MKKGKILVCEDCGQEFPFTAGEQEFYEERGLSAPKHCMVCRGKHKAEETDREKFRKN